MDTRMSLERAPEQFAGILLAPDPPVQIGRKEDQALIGIVLELPQPLLGPFQRLRLATMVEAQLRDAEIVMRGRQVLGPDGDDAIDILLAFAKTFQNPSERISLAALILLHFPPARSPRPHFLPCLARKPAVLREPDLSQDVLVRFARAMKKLPL